MTEPSPLAKAEAAVTEASTNTVAVQLALAAVELAKTAAAQQTPQQPPAACQHQQAQPFEAKKWLVIGGICVAGGLVASLFAVAVAIGAVSVGILALVLRSIWHDVQRGR